jgi:glyoxylase-like metal-dependent hydrolase (beta-lactamase superfamily II)
MERIEDGDLALVVAGPAGFANNIYIVIDRATNEAAFVDAPDEPEQSIAAAEWAGVRPAQILLTHGHRDHTQSIDILKSTYGARLVATPDEPGLTDGQLDDPVQHGSEVRVGNLGFRVLSVPGHTPAAVAFVHGRHLFAGDTLFPGGPGHSRSNENLQQEIASITRELYALPDETVVYPGHGARTTIGESRAEYAVFASKTHDPELHGDVLWTES